MTRAGWLATGSAAAVGLFVLISASGFGWNPSGWVDAATTLIPFPVCFACGYTSRRVPGLVASAWLALAIEIPGGWNPFVLVITLGPWLAGTLVGEHQRMTQRLAEVSHEIEAESERLAEEAVRLERARIARELHDIVAHGVSMMVVQAYAGERLVGTDQASAADVFENISDAAGQARREIGQLVDLLADDPGRQANVPLEPALTTLVSGATAAGLDVALHLHGPVVAVSNTSAAVVYRVVQEGITNAIKHAPGASICVSVDRGDQITVDVTNEPSAGRASALRTTGGGHGLSGIRQRVTDVGGTLEAGPTAAGAWRVSVRIPAS